MSTLEVRTQRIEPMIVRRKARYVIDLIGLASDSVVDVTIDDQVQLYQVHPTYSIALVPLGTGPQPSYEKALFLADCLSYDHDAPSCVEPSRSEFLRRGYTFLLYKVRKQLNQQWNFGELISAYENARRFRCGVKHREP